MKKSSKIILAVAALAVIGLALMPKLTPQQKEARYIQRGKDFFARGEYHKARLEYKNAAQLMPADPEIAYRWGLVDEAEGNIRAAYIAYMQAEQQNPHFYEALLKIAHYQLVADNTEEAQKRVYAVLADRPNDPEAHALQGALLLRKKDYKGTEAEARDALSRDPANITAVSVLAGLYSQQNNIAKAGEEVDKGIAQNPTDLSLLMLKARLYEKPLNLPKIVETYEAVFTLKPHDPQYRVYLADTYVGAKMPDKAEAVLRDGVAAMPDNWAMKQQLVLFLDKNRSVDSAEKEIRGYMQAHPEKDDLYLWLADLYLAHSQIDKAVALLEQIISKDEGNKQGLNARTSLAHIQFTRGNTELARKLVEAVLAKAPSNASALYVRANIFADEGEYQDAVSDLRLVIRDQPHNSEALQLLSEVLLQQGYTDLAIDTLNQLLDGDPANFAARVRLAQMYNLIGDPQHALSLLAIVTKTVPQYPVGWESTARVAISIKDFTTAENAIRMLDTLEGQHMTAAFLEGQISASTSKHEDAMAAYTKVINADPSSPLAQHALYAMAENSHTPDELEKTSQYLSSLKGDNPYASTLLGECYLRLGKKDMAVASFDKALANHPTNQDPYLDRAKIYLSDKKPEDALALLKKAEGLDPSDLRRPMMEADIYRQLGQYKDALDIYDAILTINPRVDAAANNLASVTADHFYDDAAMLEKARQAAERFANAPDPLLLDTLGWVYYRQGNFDQAQTILGRAVNATDKVPAELHYHYGAALLKKNKTAEAKTELQLAVADGAHYPELDKAREMLAGLDK